ncbi:hypothetical protein [Flavobacterium urocaniciphilum]|uniref:Uncharacterized protein n=1 Tax=Flavobacterium urocaniciphilum TaxID=1299341 RepID=A0A1H9AA29_9FLAO|nr:hypothetical protein [Flavobacterium urocaniciphilum]SEP73401.1 hypothetical protein SAMN05444005_10233 [Flavobacterium urocaniciphilum]
MKVLVLFLITIFNYNSCSSEKGIQEAKQYVEKITFQNWVGGVKGAGGGTILNVALSKSLPENIEMVKIQFQDRESTFFKVNDLSYQASIKTFDNMNETVPTPTINTGLKPSQARIYFKIDGKESTVVFDDVKELAMLEYPSINKRN